jgi:DNA-binding transcriptional MerR regulator
MEYESDEDGFLTGEYDRDMDIAVNREEAREDEREESRRYFLELLNQGLTIKKIKGRLNKEGILIESNFDEGSFITTEFIDSVFKRSKAWKDACEQGLEKDKLRIAKTMLKEWLPLTFVHDVTGLPMEKIKKLYTPQSSNILFMIHGECDRDIDIAINRKKAWEEAREEDRQYFLELLDQGLTIKEIKQRLNQKEEVFRDS